MLTPSFFWRRGMKKLLICLICVVSPASAVEWYVVGGVAQEFTNDDLVNPLGVVRAGTVPKRKLLFKEGICDKIFFEYQHISGIPVKEYYGDTLNHFGVYYGVGNCR